MNELENLPARAPSKDRRAELSAEAQIALWEKESPRDRVVDAITELALKHYALVDVEEDQSLADLTALSVLRQFHIRQRRTMATQLCGGIEQAFSLIDEVTPRSERAPSQDDFDDEYSELAV